MLLFFDVSVSSKHPFHPTFYNVFLCAVAFSARLAVFREALAVSFACWHARVCWGVAVVWGEAGVGGWGGGCFCFQSMSTEHPLYTLSRLKRYRDRDLSSHWSQH